MTEILFAFKTEKPVRFHRARYNGYAHSQSFVADFVPTGKRLELGDGVLFAHFPWKASETSSVSEGVTAAQPRLRSTWNSAAPSVGNLTLALLPSRPLIGSSLRRSGPTSSLFEWTHLFMNTDVLDLATLKQQIREQAHANRNAQPDKDDISRLIVARFMDLPEYAAARTVMFYVDVRSEVRTRNDLANALLSGKRIVVPYCVDGELELFHLESMDELELGMYRILEPRADLRSVPEKRIDVEELDLIMVPGVGFDRRGGRTGHGKGYYDKLLEHARLDTPLVALAFECQLFPEIPMQSHDMFMDKVVTEAAVYDGLGRRDLGEVSSLEDGELEARAIAVKPR